MGVKSHANTAEVLAAAPQPFTPPASLAEAADAYFKLHATRLEADKAVKALKDQEEALKSYLIDSLPKSQATGIAGKLCRVSVVVSVKPQVQDWEKFYAFWRGTVKKGRSPA